MRRRQQFSRFVVCIRNEGYEVSLEHRRIYQALQDALAKRRSLLRIIDESGEDYLYPEDFCLPTGLPKPVERALLAVS